LNRLWLTYAWKDNDDLDVDFIIQELRGVGLDVRFDRRQLMTGFPLWEQIEQQITNPQNSDAWAFIVSKRSLESPPCREELNYALQRSLDRRGVAYPLIGIFVEEVDQELVPAAIKTRLYVSITRSDWLERVGSGVNREEPKIPPLKIPPYYIEVHRLAGRFPLVVEARPRTGVWNPCVAVVPITEGA